MHDNGTPISLATRKELLAELTRRRDAGAVLIYQDPEQGDFLIRHTFGPGYRLDAARFLRGIADMIERSEHVDAMEG